MSEADFPPVIRTLTLKSKPPSMAEAHRIKSEQEAVEAARLLAEQIRPTSGARDGDRQLPLGTRSRDRP
jgi:hypothetical protein